MQEITSYYNTECVKELIQANKEGRCLILPCKVGDKVYKIGYTTCHNGADCPDSYECCGCEDECDIKKVIYTFIVPNLNWIITHYDSFNSENNVWFLDYEKAENVLKNII